MRNNTLLVLAPIFASGVWLGDTMIEAGISRTQMLGIRW